MEVLSAVFPVSSKEASSEYTPTPQEKAVAPQAWRLLESWGQLPGESNGNIDARILLDWVEEAHRLAVQAGAAASVMNTSEAAVALAVGADGIWPDPAVRDVIELMRNSKLENWDSRRRPQCWESH